MVQCLFDDGVYLNKAVLQDLNDSSKTLISHVLFFINCLKVRRSMKKFKRTTVGPTHHEFADDSKTVVCDFSF